MKRAAMAAADAVGAVGYLAAGRRPKPGLAVLCYHRIRDDIPSARSHELQNVTPSRFASQLDVIARTGAEVVCIADVAQWLDRGMPLRGSFVAFTFDDGVADQLCAAEMLHRRAWRGTFYVPTTRGDGTIGDVDVDALLGVGMDVQPHGHAHHPLGLMPEGRMHADVSASIDEIGRRTGRTPDSFAYPYGSTRLGHVNDAVVRAVHDREIRIGLTTDIGNNTFEHIVADPLRLRRIAMTQHDVGILAAAKACGYSGPVTAMKSLGRRAGVTARA